MLVIYHVDWNIEYLENIYIVSMLSTYECIIYFSYFHYRLYINIVY